MVPRACHKAIVSQRRNGEIINVREDLTGSSRLELTSGEGVRTTEWKEKRRESRNTEFLDRVVVRFVMQNLMG